MRFPIVTLGDSVRVHKALIDSLGITRLHAVAGPSGGSHQSMEWATQFPDLVGRVIHVIGPGFSISPWVIALLDAWVMPIRLDPLWNGGDYYGGAAPLEGVAQALKVIALTARHWDWAQNNFGYRLADRALPLAAALDNQCFQQAMQQNSAAAALMDGNHMIYNAKANQLYNVEDRIGRIKARILFAPAATDLLFPPQFAQAAAAKFRALGGQAEVSIIEGDAGHLGGVLNIAAASEAIRRFIDN